MDLSAKSKRLIQFFKNKPFDYVPATARTKSAWEQLYAHLCNSYTYVSQMPPMRPSVHRSSHGVEPKKFQMRSFPQEVVVEIREKMKVELLYVFSLYDRKFKVYFVLEESSSSELEAYDQYAFYVAVWLHMLSHYGNPKCAKELTIYIYHTSLEKQLPSSEGMVLSAIHANTAFTSTCPMVGEIVIFRKEEWFKVFLHETFHTFDLDFSSSPLQTKVQDCLLGLFDLPISDLRPYEAYTEFWACTMNCLFCSFVGLKNKKNVQAFIEKSEEYVNMERNYSCFQMVKMLAYMQMEYKDLYRSSHLSHSLREKYKEKTSIFSYYVLKTVLLTHYNDFMGWCMQHNSLLLDFQKTNKAMQSFCEFVAKYYKSRRMLENTEDAMALLSKSKNHYVRNNMRMTICEWT